jgi:hypothetical protein
MVKRASWLSITPEPERELPRAVATLAAGGPAARGAVEAESARIERLVLHGTQRQWLAYLHGVVELIDRRAADPGPALADARDTAAAVIANHHNLLIALPGRAAERTRADRERLEQLTRSRSEDS